MLLFSYRYFGLVPIVLLATAVYIGITIAKGTSQRIVATALQKNISENYLN